MSIHYSDLGLGKPSFLPLEQHERRVALAPNGSSTSFTIATLFEETSARSSRVHKLTLTPDNADSVLDPEIDMPTFCRLLLENPSLVSESSIRGFELFEVGCY
jgi:hypothetical protein